MYDDNNRNYNENPGYNQEASGTEERKEQILDNVQVTISDAGYGSVGGDGSKKPKKKSGVKKVFKKGIALIASAAVFGVVAGAGFQGVQYLTGRGTEQESEETLLGQTELPTAQNSAVQTATVDGALVTDVSDVIEAVMPSIVAINCTSVGTTYDWFGRPYQNEEYGSGSGIIIGQDEDEILIVTNNHVVDSATTVEIVFDDESTASATVKGTNEGSDLAVVAVKSEELTDETLNYIKVATLGDWDAMKPGQMVIAIGNALGYGQSVTVGYVSALDREVTVDGITRELLQTDAAINPGNSGGALLNAAGQVIGINSVKYASEEVEGIGFAIPVNDAIPIINELMNRETLSTSEMGFLGIYETTDVTETYSQAFNMPVGIFIQSVVQGSPAEAAGIVRGYIITGINGSSVETREELQQVLSYTRAGTTITVQVQVLENGVYTAKDIEVTLANRPEE